MQLALAVIAAAVLAGCAGPSPTGRPSPGATGPLPRPASSERLLLLAGRPGAMTLEIVDDPARTRVVLPDAAAAWISTDRAGRALVTTGGGQAWRSDPIGSGGPVAWSAVHLADVDLARLPGPLAFGSLTPNGDRAAFVAARYDTGGPFAVVIADLPSGATTRTEVARPADGAPPQWAGSRLLVITRERGDRPGITLLDTADGAVGDGPGPPGGRWSSTGPNGWTGRVDGLSVAGDGATVAAAEANASVEIHATEPWLAGRPDSPALVALSPALDGATGLAWPAIDGEGRRLAVVRTDDAGDATGVEVYAAVAGWERTRSIGLPAGASRAVVAWLPDPP